MQMYMYLQLVKVSASRVPHLVCLVPLSHQLASKFAQEPIKERSIQLYILCV